MKSRLLITLTLLTVLVLAACLEPPWYTYINLTYQFQLQYPEKDSIVTDTPAEARIMLPVQPGTNLVESYLDIQVQEGAMPCLSPYGHDYLPPGSLVVDEGLMGGEYFVEERASEGAAGSIYEWIAYSTANATDCVSLTFVMHSTNPGLSSTTPTYLPEVEENLFEQIVNSFTWLLPTFTPNPSSTPTPAVFKLPGIDTPTFTPSPLSFIPDFNAYCYKGPDPIFGFISFAIKGQSYPIDGRNEENSWLFIMLTPDNGCWVPVESGTASGDTSAIRILAKIPTPTFTVYRLDCSQFTDDTSCNQQPGCIWNRTLKPPACQNK
jgi:hypothetical protein